MKEKKTLDLTVVIPTYNRREALVRLLKSFLDANYQLVDEIVISDNHSSYDVKACLQQELPLPLLQKCRVVVNRHNIGGQGNINNSFLLSKTKWMWLIGDDDTITPAALDIIAADIQEAPDCAWFKYSTANINAVEEDVILHNLHEFIDYYTAKERHLGNLVFMSNNIYNMELLSPYLIYAFDYSYTFVSQILPPLMGLDKEIFYVKYRSTSICRFTMPDKEAQWNCIKVFLGVITIENLPYTSLSRKDIVLFKKQFVFWPFPQFAFWIEDNFGKIIRKDQIIEVCKELYFPYLDLKGWCLYNLLWLRIRLKINLFSLVLKLKRKSIEKSNSKSRTNI